MSPSLAAPSHHSLTSLLNPLSPLLTSPSLLFPPSPPQPHLLKFSQPSLTLPAGESRYIGLQFAPLPNGKPSGGETRLMVFVNNEEDKNEECMEISVVYV